MPRKGMIMTNLEAIEATERWQNCQHVHPLTCGNNSNHKLLIAMEENGDIILKCPNCDYTQNHIPECVFKMQDLLEELDTFCTPKDEV